MIAGGIEAIGTLAAALNRDLFGNRLPKLRRLVWHADADAQMWIDPSQRVLGVHVAVEQLDRREIAKLVLHELCHLFVEGEKADHGPRWQRACYQRGLCPHTGTALTAGPLDTWLRGQGW
jgi:SprT-like family